MKRQTVSCLQESSPSLLTVCEQSQDDLLIELARSPRTRVVEVGDQQNLFDGSVTTMVEVRNGLPAEKAAALGLVAE
jgi:hypothetical protein